MKAFPIILSATVLAAMPLHAQIVADGATNTLSNVTNSISGNVTVGTNGSFTLLVLSDNVLLTHPGSGIIGANISAKSNEVQLVSPGARWLMGGSLFLGSNGSFNRLVVSNGARVGNLAGVVGQESTSSNNVATVTGAGSSWDIENNLDVGNAGGGNRMEITDGGRVVNINGRLGMFGAASNNEAVVIGSGSLWSNQGGLFVGIVRGGNRLVISNGAQVATGTISYLGGSGASISNEIRVTGSGSFWRIGSSLDVGNIGAGNRIVISDGGRVLDGSGSVGFGATSGNNLAVVTGFGSQWNNTNLLYVGLSSPGNQLVVSNSGVVIASNAVYLGFNPTATENRIEVSDGLLLVTNNSGAGLFEVRQGTNVLNAGLIEVDQLLLTNIGGFFHFNGGTLSARNSRVGNGTIFSVGDGSHAATFILTGNGLHDFSGTLVASISSNATLIGNGTFVSGLAVQPGGKLIPGLSIGKMVFSNAPVLLGETMMEISKNGPTLTNDQVQVTAGLHYGGALTVSNLGPTALVIGDRFPLFSANSYTGAFSIVTLPSLPAGLNWANKLLIDGSIEVVPAPQFSSVTLSGTNVIFTGTGGTSNGTYAILTSTNVTLPLSNWVSLLTNVFEATGNFSITQAIAASEFQRYFRLRTP